MKNIFFLFVGISFGLALTKGEAASWYRIIEMFRFESFHMFGIFMTAIPVGALLVWLLKIGHVKTVDHEEIVIPKKNFSAGIVIGSFIFGFGWALTGACPGPLYVQIGAGYTVTIITLLSALAGTWVFGKVQKYLPA